MDAPALFLPQGLVDFIASTFCGQILAVASGLLSTSMSLFSIGLAAIKSAQAFRTRIVARREARNAAEADARRLLVAEVCCELRQREARADPVNRSDRQAAEPVEDEPVRFREGNSQRTCCR